VMNKSGMDKLLSSTVSLGAEASVAGGPIGREARAGTDIQLKAEILAYSRAQGLFAGIDVSGGILQPSDEDNADLYGTKIRPRDVVMRNDVRPPAESEPFLAALRRRL